MSFGKGLHRLNDNQHYVDLIKFPCDSVIGFTHTYRCMEHQLVYGIIFLSGKMGLGSKKQVLLKFSIVRLQANSNIFSQPIK